MKGQCILGRALGSEHVDHWMDWICPFARVEEQGSDRLTGRNLHESENLQFLTWAMLGKE
jgi:hypothetical protein